MITVIPEQKLTETLLSNTDNKKTAHMVEMCKTHYTLEDAKKDLKARNLTKVSTVNTPGSGRKPATKQKNAQLQCGYCIKTMS